MRWPQEGQGQRPLVPDTVMLSAAPNLPGQPLEILGGAQDDSENPLKMYFLPQGGQIVLPHLHEQIYEPFHIPSLYQGEDFLASFFKGF